MIGIYKITNKVNNKCYIGKSLNIQERWVGGHLRSLRKNTHYNKHLQSSWNKYTENCFLFEIIEEVYDKELLNDKEKYWIAYYKSDDPRCGYNQTKGGDGGYFSDEIRKKLSEQRKGEKNSFYGKKQTEYAKLRASQVHKNKKISDEQKAIISKTFKNKKLTDRHKKKISKALTGIKFDKTRRYNISRSQATTTLEQETEIIKMFLNGSKKGEIIQKYNITYKVIYRIVKNYYIYINTKN